ncbi:Uncharacterised protein [Vibrio cholerae]|nr:Uncharacterised protein [Vibrio cholerae]
MVSKKSLLVKRVNLRPILVSFVITTVLVG